jgi:hypothetical protein
MSTKKRDLAQELVDFLLKEEERKKAASKGQVQDRVKPHLVKEEEAKASPLQKTVALDDDPNVFEFNMPLPEKKPEATQGARKPLKVMGDLPTSNPEDVPETAPEAPEAATKEALKPEPVKPFSEMKTNSGASTRSSQVYNDVASLVAGTEAVKVAQARIKTLEKEKEQMRGDMEQLITSSESLQRRFNEMRTQLDSVERKHKEKVEILEDEKTVLKTRLNAREEELSKLKALNEDLQARFQNDLRKIRVRERELEHRQEIMRAEMQSVSSSKDEAIIELKRQLEKLHFELDNFRAKSADMNTKINEFYDRNHRTVKALRLALSVLETGDGEERTKKKEGA